LAATEALASLGLARNDLKCFAPEKQFRLLLNRIANGVDKIERNTRVPRNVWSRC